MALIPCPFCAEGIQSEAIVCRYCGAKKDGPTWLPPKHIEPPRGAGVLRSSGWLLLLSGIYECYSIASPVPLYGAMRGGAPAFAVHGVFAALFIASGVGLILLRYWGYQSLIATTLLYTAERLLYLADAKARAAEMGGDLGMVTAVLGTDGTQQLDSSIQAYVLLALLSWWGFVLYAYFRRESFRR